MGNNDVREDKVLYPELSYKIVGVLFDIFNELGGGYREKRYEESVAVRFRESGIMFARQAYIPVVISGKRVAKDFADFIVEDKIVLEIKRGDYFSRKHIEQVSEYLKAKNLRLGIIAQFTSRGVKFKRILNLY